MDIEYLTWVKHYAKPFKQKKNTHQSQKDVKKNPGLVCCGVNFQIENAIDTILVVYSIIQLIGTTPSTFG